MAGGGIKQNFITVRGGADGRTPIFNITDGNLAYSYDEGSTWFSLGKVVGKDGLDGKDGATGATGAKVVSMNLVNTLPEGNEYEMVFDDNSRYRFVALKGDKGETGSVEVSNSTGDGIAVAVSQNILTDMTSGLAQGVADNYTDRFTISRGTAQSTTATYDPVVIANGISLKAGKAYAINVEKSGEPTTVWFSLGFSPDQVIRSLTLEVDQTNVSHVFVADKDYSNVLMLFQPRAVKGCIVTASLEVYADNGTTEFAPPKRFSVLDFENGDAQFWLQGVMNNTSLVYRVSCKNSTFYRFKENVRIVAKEGFRFALGYYENSDKCTDEGWNVDRVIPAYQKFRIMIGRQTENTQEVADIDEYVNKVDIYTEDSYDERRKIEMHSMKIATLEESDSAKQKNIDYWLTRDQLAPKPFEIVSINHRGYNMEAPENTLPAFKLSKQKGFDFVETDIRFTSDGVPVLLHDPTIDRTARDANGNAPSGVYINQITYEEALQYDFGIHRGSQFAGTKIPTLRQFMLLCRALALHAYLDIYDAHSEAKAKAIFAAVAECGMTQSTTFVSSSYGALNWLSAQNPDVRYGLVCWDADPYTGGMQCATFVDNLRNRGVERIFVDADISYMNLDKYKLLASEKKVALEVYCPNSEAEILALDPIITGVTSDELVAKDVLLSHYLN